MFRDLYDRAVAFAKLQMSDAGTFVARNILWFGLGAAVLVVALVVAL